MAVVDGKGKVLTYMGSFNLYLYETINRCKLK